MPALRASREGSRPRSLSTDSPYAVPLPTAQHDTHAHRAGPGRLRIDYSEALPLQEFYAIIDDHFQRRGDLQSAFESLNRAAHQYRVVEKLLLSRFKDRNPAPLDNLDVVSEETYQRLVELCDGVERAQGHLAVSAANLGCAARLVALLAQHRFQLSAKDHAMLLAHLFPDVTDTEDQVNDRWRALLLFSCKCLFAGRLAPNSSVLPRSMLACSWRSKRCKPVPAPAASGALSERGSPDANPFRPYFKE